MTTQLGIAMALAIRHYDGPTLRHAARVAVRVKQLPMNLGEAVLPAAWLHDILEDTDLTADDLLEAGLNEHVVGIVQALTHGEESYSNYINGVIRAGRVETVIKLADMVDNLARAGGLFGEAPRPELLPKYNAWIPVLEDAQQLDAKMFALRVDTMGTHA